MFDMFPPPQSLVSEHVSLTRMHLCSVLIYTIACSGQSVPLLHSLPAHATQLFWTVQHALLAVTVFNLCTFVTVTKRRLLFLPIAHSCHPQGDQHPDVYLQLQRLCANSNQRFYAAADGLWW